MLSSAAFIISFAGTASAQNLKETATCKLPNTAESKTLYEGSCTVRQSMSGSNTVFTVKIGDTEPFMFAGVRGQKNWMHGPEKTEFTDLPKGMMFDRHHHNVVGERIAAQNWFEVLEEILPTIENSRLMPANGAEGDFDFTRVVPGGQALCEELAGAD